MEKYVFIIFLLLCCALGLLVFRRGPNAVKARILRLIIVLVSTAFFVWWFIRESSTALVADSTTLVIVNKLPQPLDFYIIKVKNDTKDEDELYELNHSGKIRPEHYRSESLKLQNSDEYWVAGYLGKKNLVYFSQHSIAEKKESLLLEVSNYINQSMKLSRKAENIIADNLQDKIGKSVWITLSFILLFLNITLLLQRK